ncbi:MAG: hypothetical protein WB820_18095, partial [Rhodoplanes sp.]
RERHQGGDGKRENPDKRRPIVLIAGEKHGDESTSLIGVPRDESALRASERATDFHDHLEVVAPSNGEATCVRPHAVHTVFASARAQATSVITIAPQTPHRTRSLSRSSLGIYVAMRRPHPFAIMQRTRLFATQQKDDLHQTP